MNEITDFIEKECTINKWDVLFGCTQVDSYFTFIKGSNEEVIIDDKTTVILNDSPR